jgi:signal transduction histidine kinase/two-component SAPR family response regulator/HPt (histidine-containing phosphotransfer) domain-containing protein
MEAAGTNGRILVIEDDPAIQEDFRRILCPQMDKRNAEVSARSARRRFEVDLAYQAHDGVERARKALAEGRSYALTFIEMLMPPGLDGIEIARQIWEFCPDLQVVLCAAVPDLSWEGLRCRLGATEKLLILKKPFDALEVLQLAGALLEKWRSSQQARRRLEELDLVLTERTRELRIAKVELEAASGVAAQMASKALAASKAKGEFLASMSHEIRTPMNGVLGMLRLLHETDLSDRQREFVQIGRSSAESLLDLINDVLDFSKIEAGKLDIESVHFDLQKTVEQVSEILAPKVAERKLDLVVRYAPDVPQHAIGDPCRIRQVLTNLAANAVKFTEKGHVLIEVQCEHRLERVAQVRFSVRDTGIGIAEDKLNLVFEKFAQAEASTTSRFGGTGLGLAICKQLVTLMGGRIGVASKLGEGSNFWFTLPLRVSTETASPPPLPVLEGLRVLIVDDNEATRRVLQEQMSAWNMRSESCGSGREALRLLRQARAAGDPFEIGVLDANMPEMDGTALATAIKSDLELQEIVLVMLDSLGQPGPLDGINQVLVFGCLVKPVRQSKLWNMLVAARAARSKESATQFLTRAVLPSGSRARQLPKIPARVLVVDDSTTNQKVGRLMLQNLGCTVDVSASGNDAVAKVVARGYDVVFMDCEMPDMDGYAATAEIRRRQDGHQHVPIIAMTAKAIRGDRERCLAAGMDDYVPKPVRIEDLHAILAQWVPNCASRPVSSGETGANSSAEAKPSCLALDPAMTDRLRKLAMATDPAILNDIYTAFLTSSADYISAMHRAIESSDAASLISAAHALKGASANIGARAVTELAVRLEELARSQSVVGSEELLERLSVEFARAKVEIENLMAAFK